MTELTPFLQPANASPSAPSVRGWTLPGVMEDLSKWFALALDEIDYGIVLLSADLEVLHCNHVARRELEGCHPLRVVNRRLCALPGLQGDALTSALRDSQRGLRRMITFERDGRRHMVAVVPMAPDDGEAGSLVVLGKNMACESLTAQVFARCYGLTPAEDAVLLKLSKGQRPMGIARQHGVSVATIRTHIASIRGKTGVASIAVLLDLVARLPPLVGVLKR